MEKKFKNIMFSKSGAGSISPRITLPITWLRELNITEEERGVEVIFTGKEIIIKKESR